MAPEPDTAGSGVGAVNNPALLIGMVGGVLAVALVVVLVTVVAVSSRNRRRPPRTYPPVYRHRPGSRPPGR